MSFIPDCRTDDNYNQKYLNAKDKEFIAGYDWAVERILNFVKYNTDIYPELEDFLDENKAIVNVDKKHILAEAIEEQAEANRDELITSMIDSMDESEYKAIKEKADSGEE